MVIKMTGIPSNPTFINFITTHKTIDLGNYIGNYNLTDGSINIDSNVALGSSSSQNLVISVPNDIPTISENVQINYADSIMINFSNLENQTNVASINYHVSLELVGDNADNSSDSEI